MTGSIHFIGDTTFWLGLFWDEASLCVEFSKLLGLKLSDEKDYCIDADVALILRGFSEYENHHINYI